MKSTYLLLLAASIFVSIAGARADTVDQDGILRDARGIPLQLSQERAIKACADQKMHLPTVRELAKISQSLGSEGILETSEVKEGKVPAGFHLVSAINPDGKKDEFYFSYFGYLRPTSALGIYWFWSSSVYSGESGFGYHLNGDYGDFNNDDRFLITNAVRCVVGQ